MALLLAPLHGDVPGPSFQFCMSGPLVPQVIPECFPADYDRDGDVDLADYADFVIDHPDGVM